MSLARRRLFFRRPPAVLIVLAVAALGGCDREQPAKVPVVRPVKTMLLGAPGTGLSRTFPGKVEASKKVEMAFRVPGQLIEFPVKEGQKVEEGELLARIDPRDFETQLTKAESQLERAQAELAAMKAGARPEEKRRLKAQVDAAGAEVTKTAADFRRHQSLLQQKVISQAAYDSSRAAYETATAKYRQAVEQLEQAAGARIEDIQAKEAETRQLEAKVQEAKDALGDTYLRAPFDGAVAKTFVENRENVETKQPVLRFQDIDEIEIVVDVPELDVYPKRRGDIDSVVAQFPAISSRKFEVKLTQFRTEADPETQTYQAKLTMQVPEDQHILPGTSAIVYVELNPAAGDKGDRFSVPLSAVIDPGENRPAVWVVGSEMTVHRREVNVGQMAGEDIEVTSGLKSGETIAVAGVRELEEGMKVRSFGGDFGESSP